MIITPTSKRPYQFKKNILNIKLIVAASENNVIGIKNDLPWHLPDDMLFFKKTTKNSIVIMGKKNYLSIPKKFRPLSGRVNIILSRKAGFTAENCLIAHSLEKGISLAKQQKNENIFIIGGGEVYKYALEKNLVDTIYLTRIHTKIDGDTFFPEINMKNWKITYKENHGKDDRHKYAFTFLTLEKVS